jgi:hypothetical protein
MTQAGYVLAEVTVMYTPSPFLQRLTGKRRSAARFLDSRADQVASRGSLGAPTGQPSGPSESILGHRQEVCPPSLRHAPSSWTQRLWFWLAAPDLRDVAPPIDRLPAVRREFQSALYDVPAAAADDLLHRIQFARSLRELWHLRSDVYRLVAIHHSQAQAEARLSALNRHFPSRAPRTGLMPL